MEAFFNLSTVQNPRITLRQIRGKVDFRLPVALRILFFVRCWETGADSPSKENRPASRHPDWSGQYPGARAFRRAPAFGGPGQVSGRGRPILLPEGPSLSRSSQINYR